MSEDKVVVFGRYVAVEAGFHQRLVAWFAVGKVAKTPAARCGVLLRVFHHELHVHARAGDERLDASAGKAFGEDLCCSLPTRPRCSEARQ